MPASAARGRAIKPLNELTATEIVAAIGAGRTTCEAVVRACLERIAAREAEVQAWAHLDPEQAIAAARAFDRSGRRGPLAGVPFGVKDIIDTPTCRPNGARRSTAAAAPSATPPASRSRARPAASCSARPSPPNSPTCIPARPAIRTISPARPAARRAARPPRSPTSWCRSRSAPRPPARPSARPRSAACSAIGRPMASTACTA